MSTQALPGAFRLQVPAQPASIGFVQNAAVWLIRQAGMSDKQRYAIELSIEELMLMLLRYSFDDGREEGELDISFLLGSTRLHMEVACRALPFDLSMVPDYDPNALSDDASLSAQLLKHMVDRYRLINAGKEGYRVELEWLRPLRHINEMGEPPPGTGASGAGDFSPPPLTGEVRPLNEADALRLARLVYRSYGYSYVSEFLYYPERIAARLREGTLQSWVAAAEDGQIAGHAALMRASPSAEAVEWGIAVVDPRWRGQGLMKRVSNEAVRHAGATGASVLFAHAVTNHPYTQKACSDLALTSTALLLGFAPANLKFRHIHDALRQRESTFIAMRLLKALPAQTVYLPPRHAHALQRLAGSVDIGLNDAAGSRHAQASNDASAFDSLIEPAVNVAMVNLLQAGDDLAGALARERRRLCREKVDVIYLNIDLSQADAPYAVDVAEADGFFLAGLCPMQPWPYTLTLQYLNNLELNYDAIHAVGEQAEWLKHLVRTEQQRLE